MLLCLRPLISYRVDELELCARHDASVVERQRVVGVVEHAAHAAEPHLEEARLHQHQLVVLGERVEACGATRK